MSASQDNEPPSRKRRRITPLPIPTFNDDPEQTIRSDTVGAGNFASPSGSGVSSSSAIKPEAESLDKDPLNNRSKEALKNVIAEICAETSPCDTEDLTCPVCREIFTLPFLTRCGHTFCYDCLGKVSQMTKKCPVCSAEVRDVSSAYINRHVEELVTRWTRWKLLVEKRTGIDPLGPGSTRSVIKKRPRAVTEFVADGHGAPIVVVDRHATVEQIDCVIKSLNKRKNDLITSNEVFRKLLLSDTLEKLRSMKTTELQEIQKQLNMIEADQRLVTAELANLREPVLPAIPDVPPITPNPQTVPDEAFAVPQSIDTQRSPSNVVPTYARAASSTALRDRKAKVKTNLEALCEAYVETREKSGIEIYERNLHEFTSANSIRCLAAFAFADAVGTSTIVSSVEFDKNYELFAVAGVSKRIKIYDYSSIVADGMHLHFPLIEMNSSAKISSVVWNDFMRNHIACADYDGGVTIWDALTGRKVNQFSEHQKRAWSVDFNHCDPKLLASGSDDMKVYLWSTDQNNSVNSLEAKANVCCVQFSPLNRNILAYGSADHSIHVYDLRNMKYAFAVLKSHKKAVAYVKFMSEWELVSASTDSTLRLWDLKANGGPQTVKTFTGHHNEKNFVGLDCAGSYVATGSENNSLCIYHRSMPKPAVQYKFEAPRESLARTLMKTDGGEFLSAVAWKKGSNVLVAANSQGLIEVLELV